ncbi:MAG TPA: transaldolase [Bacteroidales bacterium]|nr:transaldolase [Bacteroidales bacterium]
MKILVIDVGGTHIKVSSTDHIDPVKIKSGPSMTPEKMVSAVKENTDEWHYDAVTIGYPGAVLHGHIASEPFNLGHGWVGYDFEKNFNKPVKIINDAALQAIGSYKGGRMLFLGLGTGLGTALIIDGVIEPMELAHLPYNKGHTYEDLVGLRGLKKYGKKKWRKKVEEVTSKLKTALEADYVVLGGGNARLIKKMPEGAVPGDNSNAITGGIRIWTGKGELKSSRKADDLQMKDSGIKDPIKTRKVMKATQILHDSGQSIWLDNISRGILNDGTLRRYIDDFNVTGLTSNPTIFDKAIKSTDVYDDDIRHKLDEGKSGEELFLDLAIDDLTRAADLFRPIYEKTKGVDGWVSLELSPLLANRSSASVTRAGVLHDRVNKPNMFIKIPGTEEGIKAIEESIFNGVPINVTLLFSTEQYLAAAEAYMRGIERRIEKDLDPAVSSVASLFISRWDVAVHDKVPAELRNRLGISIALKTYKAYIDLYRSERWKKLEAAGARMQRLLWASTGTKDPDAPDVLYIEALVAPDTINTMPSETLTAFAGHGKIDKMMPEDGGDADKVLGQFEEKGIDLDALAADLQKQGAEAFEKSWNDLLAVIQSKCDDIAGDGKKAQRSKVQKAIH